MTSTMGATRAVQAPKPRSETDDARRRLLAAMPVTERRLELAGISTAVLEGGEGPPVILLHEQGTSAAQWMHVVPELVTTHRVVAPDLPGHGATGVPTGSLSAGRVFAWLAELIGGTCSSPPVLVGHMAGGAIAARFAIDHADLVDRLVLVDTFGLAKFRPSPRFAMALVRYVARPSAPAYAGLMRRCTVDLDSVRDRMGDRWNSYETYTVDRSRTPESKAALKALMRQLAVPPVSPSDLAGIAIPTTLIWGREDPAMRLPVAEVASARYGWPLHVIDAAGDDPALEQPEAFLRALRVALAPRRAGG